MLKEQILLVRFKKRTSKL